MQHHGNMKRVVGNEFLSRSHLSCIMIPLRLVPLHCARDVGSQLLLLPGFCRHTVAASVVTAHEEVQIYLTSFISRCRRGDSKLVMMV